MVDRIREMNECQGSSLAARRTPARGAVLGTCALSLVLASSLAACGQKGPLFLPTQAGAAAKPVASAPADGRPVAPMAPLEGASSPGLPAAAN